MTTNREIGDVSPERPAAPPRLPAEYVLPLKWTTENELEELTGYLHRLARWVEVTVVDGSPVDIFEEHHRRWHPWVRHVPPARSSGRNGKVVGVVTGVRAARHPLVVIADDDVRWDFDGLQRIIALLVRADLVGPQNYFDELPWHARWDTGRTLLNRALGSDYPGTYAVRRDTFLRMGGYDGDALFENLELVRTVRAAGGRVVTASDLYVRRRPPAIGHFLRQRARQAYDDFAQPPRLVAEALVAPTVLGLAALGGRRDGWGGAIRPVLGIAVASVLLAEVGRRRFGGARVFRRTAALWAPLWLFERSLCVWIAIGARGRGGVRYGDQRLSLAAHSERRLRTRLRTPAPLTPSEGQPANASMPPAGRSEP